MPRRMSNTTGLRELLIAGHERLFARWPLPSGKEYEWLEDLRGARARGRVVGANDDRAVPCRPAV
jgi:hypothetical protein